MDFPRQHPRGRPGHGDLDPLGVEDAPHEAVPAGHELDFIEQPVHGFASAVRRVAPVVFLEQEAQLVDLDSGEPVIVEAEIDGPFGGRSRRKSAWSCLRNVVLPARRMPMTAWALFGIVDSRASRLVMTGGGDEATAALSVSARTGCSVMPPQ